MLAAPASRVAHAQESATASVAEQLYLQVFINGFDQQMLVHLERDGALLSTSIEELAELGLRLENMPLSDSGRVVLNDIPGLTFHYDALAQRLDLTVPDALLSPQVLGHRLQATTRPSSDVGLVFDYALHVQQQKLRYALEGERSHTPLLDYGYGPMPVADDEEVLRAFVRRNQTAALGTSLRLFSPAGLIVNRGHALYGSGSTSYVREDSYWTSASLDGMRRWTVGDFITSSMSWTRAVRLGGAKLARDFDVRPDLVTFPIPMLGSSAVVPTTVDLYVNGIRQFTGEVGPGPFLFADPPALSGAGLVSLVYQDALGRELTTSWPLYVDERMLARGRSDYAAEIGYARHSFGSRSADYSDVPAGVGSLRYGLTDAVTLEAHTEMTEGLTNAGVGAMVALGRMGVLSAAVAYSDHDSGGARSGVLTSAGYRFVAPRWSIDLYDRRTHDNYRDLGSIEGVPVPQRLTRAGVTFSMARNQALTLNWALQRTRQASQSRITSLGYSASWFNSRLSTFVNAFQDRGRDDSLGVFMGFSFTFDNHSSVYGNVGRNGDERTASIGYSRRPDYDLGGIGIQAVADAGNNGYRRGNALISYLTPYGEWSVTAEQSEIGDSTYRNAAVFGSGSVVLMEGQFMAARAIYDGFALVSTDGMADIPILRENRVLGRTNQRGYLLVPDLPSYRTSQIAIDMLALPVEVSAIVQQTEANPLRQSGVLIEFPLDRFMGATLVLTDAQGVDLPPGTPVTLDTGEETVVGFDGRAFFPQLQPSNLITAQTPAGRCEARVSFAPEQSMRTLGPFVCVPTEDP